MQKNFMHLKSKLMKLEKMVTHTILEILKTNENKSKKNIGKLEETVKVFKKL